MVGERAIDIRVTCMSPGSMDAELKHDVSASDPKEFVMKA